jgi:hypothetical protein
MATEKRYYWMKLKLNFMTSDTVDYLMSLPRGANYVVLYQMLCLKTINTGGLLCRTLGKVVVPYDAPKIQRECKWFSEETIRSALEVFQDLGLVTISGNFPDNCRTPVLQIVDHNKLIGSETPDAERKRSGKTRKNPEKQPENDTFSGNFPEKVTIEIENRDRYINNSIEGAIGNSERGENPGESSASSDFLPVAKKILEAWNRTGLMRAKRFSLDSERGRRMQALVRDFGIETVLEGIERAGKSEFLRSGTWKVTLDWILNPDNFQKTLEGQYDERWEKQNDDLGGTDGAGSPKAGGGRNGIADTEADIRARRQEEARRRFPNLKTGLD